MDLPSLDYRGISELMALMLTAVAVLWGINKAIIIAKSH